MIDCKICNDSFKNINSLSKHITAKHKDITKEKYYFNFIGETSGLCLLCNNKTNFRSLSKGFLKYCSHICASKCKVRRKNMSESCKSKKQSKETIDKRIANTNQKRKEKSRKETMLKKYGVSNWAQTQTGKKHLSKIHKGSKKPRSIIHQKKIIKAKIKNKTIKHTEKTKLKISKSLNSSEKFQECIRQGKNISKSNGKHLTGYFNNIYFRSSYELSFLIQMFEDKLEVISAESKNFVVEYEHESKTKNYFPDFYIPSKNLIIEIKPSAMCDLPNNVSKFKAARKKYKSSFKVVTERDLSCLNNLKNLYKKYIDLMKDVNNEHICS